MNTFYVQYIITPKFDFMNILVIILSKTQKIERCNPCR